jgi:hypothetical protein
MTNFKKMCTAMLVAICLMITPVFQAYAANVDDGIMPAMEYIISSDLDLHIVNGDAKIDFSAICYDSLTKCEITITLQEKNWFSWNDFTTWTYTYYSIEPEVEVSKTISSGKTYRAVATITAWCGTQSETQTLTSSNVKS